MTRARDFADLAINSSNLESVGSTGAGGKNFVINGAMQAAQRSTSETGLGATSGYYTLDRFNCAFTTSGRLTMSQEAITDLPGFANALKLDCTTADTSIAVDEYFVLQQKFEGQDLQRIKKGTSSAESLTVSFYVKGNAAATYVCELYDADNSRSINKTFSVTTSWTRVSLTFPGDTTGTLDDDNALSFQIGFWLHAGSNFTSGTLQTSWGSETNANKAVGISSFFDSTARTFFITGLQMEIGSAATTFEHLSYGDNLKNCLRYFYRLRKTNAWGEFVTLRTWSSDDGTGVLNFPQPMRAQPTLTIDKTVNSTNFAYSLNSIAIAASDTNVTQCGIAAASSSASAFLTSGGAVIQTNGASGAIDASFLFNSEL